MASGTWKEVVCSLDDPLLRLSSQTRPSLTCTQVRTNLPLSSPTIGSTCMSNATPRAASQCETCLASPTFSRPVADLRCKPCPSCAAPDASFTLLGLSATEYPHEYPFNQGIAEDVVGCPTWICHGRALWPLLQTNLAWPIVLIPKASAKAGLPSQRII